MHYLRSDMKQLRDKPERDPGQPRHLLTETGTGYRLAGAGDGPAPARTPADDDGR